MYLLFSYVLFLPFLYLIMFNERSSTSVHVNILNLLDCYILNTFTDIVLLSFTCYVHRFEYLWLWRSRRWFMHIYLTYGWGQGQGFVITHGVDDVRGRGIVKTGPDVNIYLQSWYWQRFYVGQQLTRDADGQKGKVLKGPRHIFNTL